MGEEPTRSASGSPTTGPSVGISEVSSSSPSTPTSPPVRSGSIHSVENQTFMCPSVGLDHSKPRMATNDPGASAPSAKPAVAAQFSSSMPWIDLQSLEPQASNGTPSGPPSTAWSVSAATSRPWSAHRHERIGRVAVPVAEQGVVVHVGVDQEGAGEQPGGTTGDLCRRPAGERPEQGAARLGQQHGAGGGGALEELSSSHLGWFWAGEGRTCRPPGERSVTARWTMRRAAGRVLPAGDGPTACSPGWGGGRGGAAAGR